MSGSFLIKIDTKPTQDLLDRHARRMGYVTYTTLNRTAAAVLADEQAEMKRVLDRPTPYTLNSMRIEYARRNSLTARVLFKDGLGNKNRSPERWIGRQVSGGPRGMKAAEGRISREVIGGQQLYLVPTRYAPLDAYGNVSRAVIVKILSSIQALGDASANRRRRSRGRRRDEEYFAIYSNRPGLKPGIYRRMRTAFGAGVIPIFTFAKNAPKYSSRYDFYGTAERSAARHLPRIWAEVLSEP